MVGPVEGAGVPVTPAEIEAAKHAAVREAVEVLLGAVPEDGDAEEARELLEPVLAMVAFAHRAVPRWTLQHFQGKWACAYLFLRDGEVVAEATVTDDTPMGCARLTARLLTAPRNA